MRRMIKLDPSSMDFCKITSADIRRIKANRFFDLTRRLGEKLSNHKSAELSSGEEARLLASEIGTDVEGISIKIGMEQYQELTIKTDPDSTLEPGLILEDSSFPPIGERPPFSIQVIEMGPTVVPNPFVKPCTFGEQWRKEEEQQLIIDKGLSLNLRGTSSGHIPTKVLTIEIVEEVRASHSGNSLILAASVVSPERRHLIVESVATLIMAGISDLRRRISQPNGPAKKPVAKVSMVQSVENVVPVAVATNQVAVVTNYIPMIKDKENWDGSGAGALPRPSTLLPS